MKGRGGHASADFRHIYTCKLVTRIRNASGASRCSTELLCAERNLCVVRSLCFWACALIGMCVYRAIFVCVLHRTCV